MTGAIVAVIIVVILLLILLAASVKVAREYERDVRRFMEGRLASPPPVPANYFEADSPPAVMTDALAWPGQVAPPEGVPIWRESAVGFYRAWLENLRDRQTAAPQLELYSAA